MIDMTGFFASGPRRAAADIEAELQWAAAALNHGRPDEAERFARNVLAAIPQHAKALYLLGCALLRQNRASEAVPPLEKAARALQDPEVETQLGVALRDIGRTEDALLRLRRASKRRPAYAQAFHELGYLLFSLQRAGEAITAVEQGLKLVPGAVELWNLLGVIHHCQRDCARARAAFSQALTLAPDHPGAHYGMGAVMLDEADYAPAAEHLRRSLASNSGDAQARLKLGVSLLELGQTEDAVENFRAAVRSEPMAYRLALTLISGSARGRFWLRPSAAAKHLGLSLSASAPGISRGRDPFLWQRHR